MKLSQLKDILESRLLEVEDLIEDYGEDAELKVQSNTYFVGDSTFLATPQGFIGLNNIEEKLEDYEEDEDD